MPLAELIDPQPTLLPFAIGEGPFHIKGTALRAALGFYATQPGGLARVRAAAEPYLHRYFDEPILAGGWYDVFVSVAIDFAAARAFSRLPEEWLTYSTESQARAMLRGVYKTMLSMFTPGAMAWSLPRVSGTFFDFAQLETVERAPGRYAAEVTGVPMVLAGWYQRIAGDFAVEAMRIRGIRDPSYDWSPPRDAGPRHQLRLARMTLTFRWSE